MSTKTLDDLLKETQESKLNFDIELDSDFTELNEQLKNERPVSYSDFTEQGLENVLDTVEDLSEFDYDLPDHLDEELDNIIKTDEIEIKEASTSKTIELPKEDANIDYTVVLEPKEINTDRAIVEYRDVHLDFGKEKIINGITLDINEGEFVYFIGKSGAGKSSLTKMIYRDIVNTEGTLMVDNTNVTKLKNRNLHHLRRKVGVIFQDYKLLNDRTVYENVKYSLEVTNYPKAKRKDQVLKVLKLVGIYSLRDKYPDELSGGQQQRVAIARAIVDDPKIIVADEPTGNLDPSNALVIMKLLEKINESGTTVVMATHDVGIVNKFNHRVVLIGEGNILSDNMGGYTYE